MNSQKFDQILNALSACVFLLDENRSVVFANAAASERFGADIEGQSFVRIVRHPECLRAIDEVVATSSNRDVEITLGAAPSATFAVKVMSLTGGQKNGGLSQERLKDFGGARVALTFEDVSQIRDAQLMRSEFVANVSHELRSPLTALAGFVETLKETAKDDPDARLRFLDLMDHEAARMKRLIDDLLSLSKLQGKERIRPSGEVAIGALLDRVIETLDPVAEKERKHIKYKNDLGDLVITADEDEIVQVFHNIVENAIKYGAVDTDVTIEMSHVERAAGIAGSAIVVSVQDRGMGIHAEDIPRLTERFYRADKSRSRVKGGTGLGLAIVKHILKRHSGRLQIESAVGHGSTFTVFLPAGGKL